MSEFCIFFVKIIRLFFQKIPWPLHKPPAPCNFSPELEWTPFGTFWWVKMKQQHPKLTAQKENLSNRMILWFFPRGTAIFERAWDHHQCAHCYWWTINLSGWQAIHIFWKVGIFISTFQGLATLPRFFSVAFGHLALHREEQERLQIPSWVLTVATHQKICKEQATTCYVLMPSER